MEKATSYSSVVRTGEEIISGAKGIHTPELQSKRAIECGINESTIKSYIESFSYRAPPHGGFGVSLKRVVMIFCALENTPGRHRFSLPTTHKPLSYVVLS